MLEKIMETRKNPNRLVFKFSKRRDIGLDLQKKKNLTTIVDGVKDFFRIKLENLVGDVKNKTKNELKSSGVGSLEVFDNWMMSHNSSIPGMESYVLKLHYFLAEAVRFEYVNVAYADFKYLDRSDRNHVDFLFNINSRKLAEDDSFRIADDLGRKIFEFDKKSSARLAQHVDDFFRYMIYQRNGGRPKSLSQEYVDTLVSASKSLAEKEGLASVVFFSRDRLNKKTKLLVVGEDVDFLKDKTIFEKYDDSENPVLQGELAGGGIIKPGRVGDVYFFKAKNLFRYYHVNYLLADMLIPVALKAVNGGD